MESTLGQRIQHRRKLCGRTQQEAADFVGVARPSLVQWEKDITNPTLPNLTKLCQFLEIEVSALLAADYLNLAPLKSEEPVAAGSVLSLISIIAGRDIGFEPTAEQTLRWLIKKAGLTDAVHKLETA
jgi:transcriptional regulator with XRE-family HTH domain